MFIKGKKWLLFFVFSVLVHFSAKARQEADDIVFDSYAHDFGRVVDSNERVAHTFRFINNSRKNVSIAEVNPSCGCIVTDYSRDKIQPGDSGMVNLVFNPYNRPGAFSKYVDVIFTDGRKEQVSISGTVIFPLTTEEEFPYSDGVLRSEKRRILLTNAEAGSLHMIYMRFYNISDDTLVLAGLDNTANNPLDYNFDKQSVAPNEEFALDGVFKIPEESGYYEFGQQFISLGKDSSYHDFDIAVSVVQKSATEPGTSGEGAYFAVDKVIKDLGKISQGTIVETSFTITNTGFDGLDIKNIVSNCNCIRVDNKKHYLLPEESVELKVYLDTSALRGVQQKALHIFSNSNDAGLHRLMIKVNVTETE